MDAIKAFFAEYWLFLLIPALIIGVGLAWLLLSGQTAGTDVPVYVPF